MGLEELRKEILEEADRKIEDILNEARLEAEKIISDAKRKAESIREAKRNEVINKLEEKRRAELAIAKIEGRRLVYNKKWEYVERVFKEAWRKLMEYKGRDEYFDEFIPRAITHSVKSLGLDEVVIHLNKDDAAHVSRRLSSIVKKVRSDVGRNLSISISRNPIDISGGIIVTDKDEKIYFNLSFDARIKEARDKLTYKVFEILFGGE